MKKTSELEVRGTLVRVAKIGGEDFVCLTDMAKLKSEDPSFTINHWMRNRMTIEYLGLWESLYNDGFNPTEFGRFREQSGLNSFTLSPSKWIAGVNAIGMAVQAGRCGVTEDGPPLLSFPLPHPPFSTHWNPRPRLHPPRSGVDSRTPPCNTRSQ